MPTAAGLRQPTCRHDIIFNTSRVHDLGVVGLKCRIPLWASSEGGPDPVRVEFLVDSGASYTLIDLSLAVSLRLPVPPAEAETSLSLMTAHGTSPMRVRPGRVRCWLGDDCRGYPFDWPVLFRVNAPRETPSVLGLGGVIRTCRWTFDGTFSFAAPHGMLTLEDIR